MNEWKIEGTGARLAVRVLSYERASATNQSDANWLRCKVEATFGTFSGSAEYAITTTDLAQFENSLREMLEGQSKKASFSTMEEGIGFELDLNGRGQSTVSGFLRSPAMPKVKIEFAFQSDQSYLHQTLAALSQVNGQFPKRLIPT
jgi:hypothetical protein